MVCWLEIYWRYAYSFDVRKVFTEVLNYLIFWIF